MQFTTAKAITMQEFASRNKEDRRSGKDRRQSYDLNYFLQGGVERRKRVDDRRTPFLERRKGWVRINPWRSVYVGM